MPHVRLDVLQKIAQEQDYAVPHFIGGNVEMILAAVRAAEDCRSPLALGFAPEVLPFIPLEIAVPLMADAARRADVPVATQLEHGKDEQSIFKSIELGATSVMFDGSALPYEENIRCTHQIVRRVRPLGIAVEAELGSVGGGATASVTKTKSHMTDPATVSEFVERTGIDTLAIAFGNVHGAYHREPCLNLDLVREIRRQSSVPLVMHGGSGLTAPDYRRCYEAGISNIHFFHGVAIGAYDSMLDSLSRLDSTPLYSDMIENAIDYFYKRYVEIFEMLNSAGKADHQAFFAS